MLKRLLVVAFLTGALLASAGTDMATGQGVVPVQAQGLRAACMADYMRLCRGTPMGRGRIILCLNMQADKLSQSCFQALTLRGLAFANALKACRADFDRFCGNAPVGLQRSLACLMQNADALSQPCQQALADDDFLDGPTAPRGNGR